MLDWVTFNVVMDDFESEIFEKNCSLKFLSQMDKVIGEELTFNVSCGPNAAISVDNPLEINGIGIQKRDPINLRQNWQAFVENL